MLDHPPILGVNPGHDGTACVLKDGRIVSAVAEERLSRVKMHQGFPYRAIPEALRLAGVRADEIKLVAIPSTHFFVAPPYYVDTLFDPSGELDLANELPASYRAKALAGAAKNVASSLVKTKEQQKAEWVAYARARFERELAALGVRAKIQAIDHHTAHAASAYWTSGRSQCLVVTVDGAGDGLCASASTARDGELRRFAETPDDASPGAFYAGVTKFLGFRRHRHEGKITGLAAFGDRDACYGALAPCLGFDAAKLQFTTELETSDGLVETALALATGSYLAGRTTRALMDQLERSCKSAKREDVAAATQRILEERVTAFVAAARAKTGDKHVVLAGGTFANVKLNQRILALDGVESVFVHPNMGDGGTSVGAALEVLVAELRARGQKLEPWSIDDVFLGPSFTEAQVQADLDRAGLRYRRVNDIAIEAAKLVADGKIVGRFRGRMEYGPRALGNRSILANPNDPTINDWLNERLRRTEFMPFAPSCLEEEIDRYFHAAPGGYYPARFMTITFDAKPETKETCRAIVHVDGTTRPQSVSRARDPEYHRLLSEYRRLTGRGLCVNTSFNMHEEPIVCSPYDAVRSLLVGACDVLAIEDFIAEPPAKS